MSYLNDVLPPRVRYHLYGVMTLALAIYGIWQATEGDWTQFGVSLLGSATTALAQGNTPKG